MGRGESFGGQGLNMKEAVGKQSPGSAEKLLARPDGPGKISRSGPMPLYKQILAEIRSRIFKGEIKPHDPVPSQNELASLYGVSTITSRRVLTELEREHLIYRVHGRGSFVADPSECVPGTARSDSLGLPFPEPSNLSGTVVFLRPAYELQQLYNPFYAEILEKLRIRAKSCGLDVSFMTISDHEIQPLPPALRGFIVAGIHDKGIIRALCSNGLPVISIYNYFPDLDVPYVTYDNLAGGYLAVSHLISLGHRRIGIIQVGPSDELPFYDRQRGYELAFKQSGIPIDKGLIEVGPISEAFGREAMLRLLSAPEPPTAVFAFTDILAMGAMKAATEKGLSIPEDISIVGYDDQIFAELLAPPLTTVNQRGYTMGDRAFELLLALLNGKSPKDTRVEVTPQLIVRGSTAPLQSG